MLSAMTLPNPDDPAQAPVWDNYVVAQAVHASLALIPAHTLALGVAVDRFDVELVFQLSEATEQDRHDINEISENFEALVGDDINVTARHEVRQAATCRRSMGSAGSTLRAAATTTTDRDRRFGLEPAATEPRIGHYRGCRDRRFRALSPATRQRCSDSRLGRATMFEPCPCRLASAYAVPRPSRSVRRAGGASAARPERACARRQWRRPLGKRSSRGACAGGGFRPAAQIRQPGTQRPPERGAAERRFRHEGAASSCAQRRGRHGRGT
jgi:hypothetical protein